MVGRNATKYKGLFRKELICILLVVLLTGTPLAMLPQQVMGADSETELVPNAGFEEVTDGKPNQWMPLNQNQDDLYDGSTEEVYEGSQSVKLDDPSDTSN